MPLAASIDVGSNTVRLLVAEVEGGGIVRETLNLRAITRLGEGLGEGGRLRSEARERTLRVLEEYARRLEGMGVTMVSAVGTEALRRASDAAAFVADVRDAAGLDIEVITGEEEAARTLRGVRAGVGGFAEAGEKLVVDIGGGSTELVLTRDWSDFRAVSLPLGAVSLYERFLRSDPPRADEVSRLESYCLSELGRLKGFGDASPPALIGTAGTITTLAAVELGLEEYDPVKVTGHRISRATVDRLLWRLVGLTKEQRMLLAGLEAGREDIIVSGTALLGVVMDRYSAFNIVVCDYGLREGNLLDYLEKKGA